MTPSTYHCKRTVAILRQLHDAGTVTDLDRAFARDHIRTCDRCLADSAVIRAVAVDDLRSSDVAFTANKVADSVLRRLHEEDWTPSFSTPGLPRRYAGWLAAAAAFMGIVFFVALWLRSGNDASPSVAVSDALPQPPFMESGSPPPPSSAFASPSNSRPINDNIVRTTTDERRLLLPTGIGILLHPDTELQVIPPTQKEMAVALTAGDIFVSVDPERSGPPFSVLTPDARITVTGTLFSVTTRRRHRVAVLRGHVEVIGPAGEKKNVATGESLSLIDGEVGPIEAVEHDTLRAVSARLARGDLGKMTTVDMQRSPLSSFEEDDPFEQTGHATASEPATTLSVAKNTPAPPSPSIEALLSEVRAFRENQQWQAAAGAYRDIIRFHPNTRIAADAWVALGEIQLNKLKSPKSALHSFNQYLGRGSAALTEEALIGKAKALDALSLVDDEQRTLRLFQSMYPRSAYAPFVKKRLSEIGDVEK